MKTHSSRIDKLAERDDILLQKGQEQEVEVKKLKENMDVLFETLSQLNRKEEGSGRRMIVPVSNSIKLLTSFL